MDAHNEARRLCRWVAATALSVLVNSHAQAAPMKIEAVMTPKADSKLEFADGSKRYLVAAHREGRASGNGPLAGTAVVEWGMHEVDPATGADASGYLVFSSTNGDIAYLKYRFRAVPVPNADGKLRFVAHGVWESAGGSGRFKGLRGIGNVAFNPSDRRWTLEGDLAAVQ